MKRRELIGAGVLLPFGGVLTAAEPPEQFDWLVGEWRGEGTFMRRPSIAELDARMAIDDRFLEIMWRVDAAGDKPLHYEGRGLYRPIGTGVDGRWFDNSSAIRPLTGVAGPNILSVTWGTAETERGTSLYTLAGDILTVEDAVFTSSGARPFATHRLKRRE